VSRRYCLAARSLRESLRLLLGVLDFFARGIHGRLFNPPLKSNGGSFPIVATSRDRQTRAILWLVHSQIGRVECRAVWPLFTVFPRSDPVNEIDAEVTANAPARESRVQKGYFSGHFGASLSLTLMRSPTLMSCNVSFEARNSYSLPPPSRTVNFP
jgi:hypothetical protein